MISSVGSAGGSGLIAAAMKDAAATQAVGIAVIKKTQDIEKANGESALKLIASTTAVMSSVGIDVHV